MAAIYIHVGAFFLGAVTTYASMYLLMFPALVSGFIGSILVAISGQFALWAGWDAVSFSDKLARVCGGIVFFVSGILQRLLMAWVFLAWFRYFSEQASPWFVCIFLLTAFLPVPNLTRENNIGFSLGQFLGAILMWRLLIS